MPKNTKPYRVYGEIGRFEFITHSIVNKADVLFNTGMILGASLRRLRQDWVSKYGHDLCLVETFVDRSCFAGTCYRAANWRKAPCPCGEGYPSPTPICIDEKTDLLIIKNHAPDFCMGNTKGFNDIFDRGLPVQEIFKLAAVFIIGRKKIKWFFKLYEDFHLSPRNFGLHV